MFVFYGGKYILDEIGLEAVMLEYILLFLAYACLGIKILMTEYTKKEAACGLGLFVLAALCFAFNRNEYLITNVILVFSLKNIDLEELFRKCFWIGLATVVFTMLMSFELGTMGFGVSDRGWLERDTMRMRYSFGYSTPNTCHMYLWRLEMLYIYANYSRIRLPHILFMLGLNLLLYQFTVSRTGFLGTFFLLLCLLFVKAARPLTGRKWFGTVIAAVYILFGICICVLVFRMQNTVTFTKLDYILSRRLSLAAARAEEIPVSVFGNHYVGDYTYIDCGWISMLLQWGIVWFVLYNVAMVALILKGAWQKRPELTMLIFASGIYGFGESSVMEKGVASISVLLIAEILYKQKKKAQLESDRYGYAYRIWKGEQHG